MKKVISLMMSAALVFGFAACEGNNAANNAAEAAGNAANSAAEAANSAAEAAGSAAEAAGNAANSAAEAAGNAAEAVSNAVSGSDADWITGTSWTTIMYYGVDGTEYNLEDYAAANGVTANEVVFQYTFNADGTVDLLVVGADLTTSGTYTADDKSVTVSFEGSDPATFTLEEDGTLYQDNSAIGAPSVRYANIGAAQ